MELNVKRIIARAMGSDQRKVLEKMGVAEILSPEDEVGGNVAEMLINPEVVMCIQLPDDYEIVEVKAPSDICGRNLEDIGLRQKYKLNLVTLLRRQEGSTSEDNTKDYHIIGVPDSNTVIEKTDIIVIFGLTKNIERFLEINK